MIKAYYIFQSLPYVIHVYQISSFAQSHPQEIKSWRQPWFGSMFPKFAIVKIRENNHPSTWYMYIAFLVSWDLPRWFLNFKDWEACRRLLRKFWEFTSLVSEAVQAVQAAARKIMLCNSTVVPYTYMYIHTYIQRNFEQWPIKTLAKYHNTALLWWLVSLLLVMIASKASIEP